MLKMFFSTQGRIARKPYWLWGFVLLAIEMVLYLPAIAYDADALSATPAPFWFRVYSLVVMLLTAWPVYAMITKRLHDRGQSDMFAWIYTTLAVIIYAADVISPLELKSGITTTGWIIALPALLLGIALLIETGFRRGTAGPNAYGDDPLG
jgi:uncharacterized membrane protein YhaH (DUF805 family)